MEKIITSSSIMNNVLLNQFNFNWDRQYAILVHTSVINKVENVLNETLINTDWEICEHILQIGSERFEMHLINILRSNKDQENFVRALVYDSQVSFPWEENPTLFIAAAEFHIMEEFIYRYNLETYILKIEEKLGYFIGGDHPIKVVSFNQSISAKLNILYEFKILPKSKNQGYLFVANALPWQQSNLLRRIHLNGNIYSVLPIILSHLGTLNYANDLNIMDLLSLRLAISDVRDDPSYSNLLSYEIDFMIKRTLTKLIKNNHLSIRKYLVAKNIKLSGLLFTYLVYEFQHLFQTLDFGAMYEVFAQKSTPLKDTIKLNEEIDVLNKLKERFNVNYSIDGKDFDNMSLSLFVDLIKLENVSAITLDTNYRWCDDVFTSKHNTIIPGRKEERVNICLEGENTYNFIECFMAELKTIKLGDNNIALHINCNLNDYKMFDDLKVYKIIFSHIKIDLTMLQNLQQCAIKPPIKLYECSLENNSYNWQLLNNSERLDVACIYEDEGTWLSMFEFILKEIHKSTTNEFQFNYKREFEIMEPRPLLGFIELNSMKFVVDEQNSKLEIRCVDTDEIVDLYCKKCKIKQDNTSDYEFYQ